ncbi:sensor histidine kinase [Sphingomonas sp. H160509]|jgi:two-component sensor histidine kinase|uniref:sensor histidine kinase n=1 Tax=Sphingomonas sp. H160509 TaxID=2955313 RepID=UPI0020978CD3|nr:sensor histidine kinase [Sphingomonas sp. H160509]MDD1451411.1 sensor histidine kinase [Sphingomonas sp. H160509]
MTSTLHAADRIAPRTAILPAQRAPTTADEINHRIANSLQLLAAMVSAEARTVADPAAQAALDMTVRRIAAIARVNRQLYQQSAVATINLDIYLRELGGDLEGSFGNIGAGRRIRVIADPVSVKPDHASSVGILVSELVTNACKHAYAPDAPGDVHVRLAGSSRGYRLEVEDRGNGKGASFFGNSGLGQRLVETMAVRLDGRLVHEDAKPGTRHVLHVSHA